MRVEKTTTPIGRISRVLVLRAGSLGDFILTLPIFQLIREKWPAAYIEAVVRRDAGLLARDARLIDAVVSIDASWVASFYSPAANLSAETINYIRGFDVVISLLHDPDGVVRKNFLVAGANRLVCHSPLVKTGHAIEHLLASLRALGIQTPEGVKPKLHLPSHYRQRGHELLSQTFGANLPEHVLALHPGSGSSLKNWPLINFCAVAELAQNACLFFPVFILGEAEEPFLRSLLARQFKVVSNLSLADLAALLTVCSAYVGNDSGVTHLAAALGLPVIAIFGPTDPAVWGPRGLNVRIIRQNSPSHSEPPDVGVVEVLETLSRLGELASDSRTRLDL